MARFSYLLPLCNLLCIGLALVNALPAKPVQPLMSNGKFDENDAAGTNSNSTDGTNDDISLILMQDKTSTGWLLDFIIQKMTQQCGGQTEPALQFYNCITNTTQLPTVWAMMGLDRTAMNLETVDKTTFQGFNITEETNFFVTLMQEDSSSAANATAANQTSFDLQALLAAVSAQSQNFCLNVDGLLTCLNPYLSACFPDLDDDNFVGGQNAATTTPAVVQIDDNATADSSANSSDNEGDTTQESFFLIPLLFSQSQIFPLLQRSFTTVCENQASPLQKILQSLPCLMQGVDDATTACPFCQNFPSLDGPVATYNDTTNTMGDDVDVDACSFLRNCLECQMDVASMNCGEDVAMIIHQVVQAYFDALQCFPDAGGNSIRLPFNVSIL